MMALSHFLHLFFASDQANHLNLYTLQIFGNLLLQMIEEYRQRKKKFSGQESDDSSRTATGR